MSLLGFIKYSYRVLVATYAEIINLILFVALYSALSKRVWILTGGIDMQI